MKINEKLMHVVDMIPHFTDLQIAFKLSMDIEHVEFIRARYEILTRGRSKMKPATFKRQIEIQNEFKWLIVPLLDKMNDAAIARLVGCSREYVRQVRKPLGIKSPHYKKPMPRRYIPPAAPDLPENE